MAEVINNINDQLSNMLNDINLLKNFLNENKEQDIIDFCNQEINRINSKMFTLQLALGLIEKNPMKINLQF